VDFFYSLLPRIRPLKISRIHGKMSQDERSRTYGEFTDSTDVLLCTDVAARGIDFKDIEDVVHFDIPKDYTNVVHRSGRTARNGAKGQSVVFIMPNERAYIEFLKLKNIKITPGEMRLGEVDADDYGKMKSRVDAEMLSLAVRGFVSYIRSYKEHIVSFILDYRGLDYNSLAKLYFLDRIPTMPELRNVKFAGFEKKACPKNKPRAGRRRAARKVN
jgi:ATP-dependent RNA helicase DDX55/SPB4